MSGNERLKDRREKFHVTPEELAETNFALIPREQPKSADKKDIQRARRINRERGISTSSRPVVGFDCLPSNTFWNSRPKPSSVPFTTPIEVRSSLARSTSILPIVRISLDRDGLYLTHEDARRLRLPTRRTEMVLVKDLQYLRYPSDVKVTVRFPSIGGHSYTFQGDKLYSHLQRSKKVKELEEQDCLDPVESILGIKHGLEHHAVLFRRSLVYVMKKQDYVQEIDPYLCREPLRSIQDRPPLQLAKCVVCNRGESLPEVERRIKRRKLKEHREHCKKEKCNFVRKCKQVLRGVSLKCCSLCVAYGDPDSKMALFCSSDCHKVHWKVSHRDKHYQKWKEEEDEEANEEQEQPLLDVLADVGKRIYPAIIITVGAIAILSIVGLGFAFLVVHNLAALIPVLLLVAGAGVGMFVYHIGDFFPFPQEEPPCSCKAPVTCPKCHPFLFRFGIRTHPTF